MLGRQRKGSLKPSSAIPKGGRVPHRVASYATHSPRLHHDRGLMYWCRCRQVSKPRSDLGSGLFGVVFHFHP